MRIHWQCKIAMLATLQLTPSHTFKPRAKRSDYDVVKDVNVIEETLTGIVYILVCLENNPVLVAWSRPIFTVKSALVAQAIPIFFYQHDIRTWPLPNCTDSCSQRLLLDPTAKILLKL